MKSAREEGTRWGEPGKCYHMLTAEATPLSASYMYKKRGVASTQISCHIILSPHFVLLPRIFSYAQVGESIVCY